MNGHKTKKIVQGIGNKISQLNWHVEGMEDG
jgi:hypothetical protein